MPKTVMDWLTIIGYTVAVAMVVGGAALAFRKWLASLVVGDVTTRVMGLLVPPVRLELAVLKVSENRCGTSYVDGRRFVARTLERLRGATRRDPWFPDADPTWFCDLLAGLRSEVDLPEAAAERRRQHDLEYLRFICEVLVYEGLAIACPQEGRTGYCVAPAYAEGIGRWIAGDDPHPK